MATEDNIISSYLEGELDYIYHKYGEEKYNEIITNKLVRTNRISSSSSNIKHYIIFGEECLICNEKILTNKTAFINTCGHFFHKKCIFTYSNIYFCNYKKDSSCPLCRKEIDVINDLWLYEKYNSNHLEFNFLDKLENFINDEKYNYDSYYCKKCDTFSLGKQCFNCDY